MVIPDYEILKWAWDGGVDPFNPARVNPASLDLCWSGRFRTASNDVWSKVCRADHLTIRSGDFYLLDTLEYLKIPRNWTGMLALKSSMGRSGLEHNHAGFFDPGFEGTGTLEITNHAPWSIVLDIGQPIAQMIFIEMKTPPKRDYSQTGRYQGQNKPEPERPSIFVPVLRMDE